MISSAPAPWALLRFQGPSAFKASARIRARTGVIVDNLLLYVTGGFAYANTERTVALNIPGLGIQRGLLGRQDALGLDHGLRHGVAVRAQLELQERGALRPLRNGRDHRHLHAPLRPRTARYASSMKARPGSRASASTTNSGAGAARARVTNDHISLVRERRGPGFPPGPRLLLSENAPLQVGGNRKPQAPVTMLFRSLIGLAMVCSASMPSPVPRIFTVPKSSTRPRND